LDYLRNFLKVSSLTDISVTFEELMHQQELLRTEAERMRRLEEVPEITAETEQDGNETEHEVAANNSSQENRGAN